MNKKTKFAILGVIALVLVTLSLTYAYWLITRTQTKENVITAGCLDISLSNEQNDISLSEQFPISDDEGKELTPYTFTVTNNCNTEVDYNVNLEVLGDESENMSSSSIKVMLDDGTPVLVSNKLEVEATNADAYEAHLMTQGTLSAKGTATHSVRLWIDVDAPISEMNKTFSSKVSVTAGQGIINPIKEGTLAYNLVSQYDGIESITALDSTWAEGEFGTKEAYGFSSSTKYYYGTDYTFDPGTGNFALAGTLVQATVAECRAGTVTCGKYTLLSSSSSQKYKYIYEVTSFTGDTADTDSKVYITRKKKSSANDFSAAVLSGETSLHNTPDNYGISYYLRGDITNNYVKFGTFSGTQVRGYGSSVYSAFYNLYDSLEECNASADYNRNCAVDYEAGDDIYWRIIRINGDGTIRMIYDGPELIGNNVNHSAAIVNSGFDANGNVGYTNLGDNGEQADSTAKSNLDEWYKTNLKETFGKYIADNLFCNDRTIYSSSSSQINYSALNRVNIKLPSLECSQKEDRYTISSVIGNGYLENPIGLITSDEYMLLGGGVNNSKHFLRNTDDYTWTMSPYSYIKSSSWANVGLFNKNSISGSSSSTRGQSTNDGQRVYYYSYILRPVINLKTDVAFTGNGTIDSPYVITTN